jgi:hypothetical protein
MPDMSYTELIWWCVCAPLGLMALVLGGFGLGVWWMRQRQSASNLATQTGDASVWAHANYANANARTGRGKKDDDDDDEHDDDDYDGDESGDGSSNEGSDSE